MAVFVTIIVYLIRKANRDIQAEYSLSGGAKAAAGH